jgi:hypothetical protein
MVLLDTTAKGASSNGYVTQAEADEILKEERLHASTDWDSGIGTASGYLVNDPGPALQIGDTSIPVDTGTGTFQADDEINFAGHATTYELAAAYSGGAGNLTITPGLTAVPANDAVITKLTDAKKKHGIIWATLFLEQSFTWYGLIRDNDQARQHPRSGLVDQDGRNYDYDLICDPLKEATAVMAYLLKKKDRTADNEVLGQGFERAKLGDIEIVVDKLQAIEFIPQYVRMILGPIGKIRNVGVKSGFRVMNLKRS